MSSEGRRCIFCGNLFQGQKKNFEHIIPKWLVEEADLNRRQMTINRPNRPIKIGMGRIGMKVCESCNSQDAILESNAKQAYLLLKDGKELSNINFQILLNWLDKVRVGLWLWSLEHAKDRFPIDPKFRINERVARKDRIIIICRYPDGPKMKGLRFWGVNEYFLMAPCCMGMLINNIAIVSLSNDYLLTRHIRNLSINIKYRPDDIDEYEFVEENKIKSQISLLGTQSIFGQCILHNEKFNELGIEVSAASSIHDEISESSIFRLDGKLNLEANQPTTIPFFNGNVSANMILMELNIAKTMRLILQDAKSADTQLLDIKRRTNIKTNIDSALLQVDSVIVGLEQKFWENSRLILPSTGLTLPVKPLKLK